MSEPLQGATGASRTSHWAHIGESTFVSGMWLLYQVHRWLGRWPFLLCLSPVVVYYWATRGLARRSSLQYLQRIYAAHGVPSLDKRPGWRQTVQHFWVFAQVILDKMLALSGRYRADDLHFVGTAPLIERLRSGQGAIVVTAHMGCIEVSQAMAQYQTGLRLNILVHNKHAQRFNRLMERLSPGTGVQLLQVDNFNAATAMVLSEKMERGEFIAIAGDRVPVNQSKVTHAQFLGHEAAFPIGPYILASLLKCPLYFMGCVHEGKGYCVEFVKLADSVVLPRAQREVALGHYAGLFAAQMESMLQRAPYDWFNFFPFWDQGTRRHAKPSET